jgi:hypothetical protein
MCSVLPYPRMSSPVFSTLRLPAPTMVHPRALDYEQSAADVLIAAGLLTYQPDDRATRRFLGSVVLDPYVYPYASLERLLCAGAFSQWLFFLDDECDDDPALGRDPDAARAIMAQYFEVLRSGALPKDPSAFARFTVYLRRRLSALAPEGWLPRFLASVEDYLFRGSMACYEHWSLDRVPTLAVYEPLRMHDSAVFAAVDMIELAAETTLPREILRMPALSEMREITARHVAFVNDLFSYQKEVLLHGSPWNLVHVLSHERGLSFEAAVRDAIAIANADVARFLQLERQIPALPVVLSTHVQRYVAGMKSWMRGNVDYALASRRYRAPDSPFLELRGEPPSRISHKAA